MSAEYIKKQNEKIYLETLETTVKLQKAELSLVTRLLCNLAKIAMANNIPLEPELDGWFAKQTNLEQQDVIKEARAISTENAQAKHNQVALNQFQVRNYASKSKPANVTKTTRW